MTKAKVKRKTTWLQVRVDERTKKRAFARARAMGVGLSEYVRRLIEVDVREAKRRQELGEPEPEWVTVPVEVE